MKANKVLLSLVLLAIGLTAQAQQRIQLRSTDKAECVKSDMTRLKASFSFSTIEAQDYENERGTFSWLSLPNTVIGGNEGDPQIPAVSELIAVPFGATPSIRVTSYSTTEYDLEDYGIHRLMPRQPDIRKDQRPEDVPFVYNEAAYQTRGLRSEPLARVSIDGVMRGVQVGRMSIEPVSYDPVNNKIRVFNDIQVEVSFDGADARATEDMLVSTYSPYFNGIYDQLFNGRAVRDVYDEHPDLWQAPVRMLVIANRMFESCIQDWLAWKTMKGIYVDVNYTDNIGSTASAIQSFIQNKYAQNAPTFLMIMGDKDQVPASATGSETSCVTDLSYSSIDGDQFADMFHSRFPAENVAQMTAMLNKALEYEQYTMPDPSYLNNVLLIAGEDSGWGVTVGRPTIWYATNYYYNTEHGFQNVYEYSHGTYTGCYNNLNTGVGFANYTAHGSNTSWAGPQFTVSDVNNLTNTHKYFLAMGNCCQAADWGISGTCFGEAMVRAENKGAYAYIGSCPSTYWLNDYYFGVGATSRADGTMPSYEETTMGCYDAIWRDDAYNTVNAILYVGNLAGNAAQALGYTIHISTLYCWQAYHVLGDGSIMPYRVQPTANNVSHMAIFPIGMPTYEVSAVPGSYVAISKDGVLYGTALVGTTGTVQVPITPITSSGDVTICVTAPNRIPYIATVPAAALEGAYLSVDGYTPTEAHVGDDTNLSITFKNVGTDASTGTTNITLTSNDPDVITVVNGTGSFGALAPEATTTVSGFQFRINPGVADETNTSLHYSAVNGNDTYEGNIVIKANEAVLEYQNLSWNGSFFPGETLTLTAKFKNTGHYQATNAVATMNTNSNYLTITNSTVNVGTIAVDQEVTCQFTVTIAANCPETAQIPVTFTMTAAGGLTAQGNETLKNACNVYFNLSDSYGDGWNGASLTVSFNDGTDPQSLTISSGNSANYALEIGNGTHVTLTWNSGSYDGECSFTVSYEGDLVFFTQTSRPSSGVLYEFDCNCAAASQTFMVNVSSSNTEQGTVSGGGEFNFGQSCTVVATPAEGYMFTNWTQNGVIISSAATYTFLVNSDMNLVANFAEGNMIGDGGETTDQYLPSYNYYNYTLSQQIYTAEELGSAGVITSIAFFNGGTEKTRTYDFYLKATTKSTFSGNTDWEVVTAADKVFSGSVTMVAGNWTFITFDTPFAYDGSSNLVLVTDDNTGSYTSSPHMSCRVFDAPSQALRIYSDGTNYDPFAPTNYSGTVMNLKNQLLFTKEAPSTELFRVEVSANPSVGGTVSGGGEFEFGETCTVNAIPAEGFSFVNWTQDGEVVSTEASYSFSVNSNRNLVANFMGSLHITASVNPANAGTVNGAGEFVFGQTCTLEAIPAEGYFFVSWTLNGEVVSTSVSYSFVVEEDMELVANFAEGHMIGGGDATNSYLPSYNFYNYSLTQQIYTVEELGSAGVITSIAFYNGGAEKTRTYDFYMKATEKDSFTGSSDWEVVTESDKVFSGEVTMTADEWTFIIFSNPFIYDGISNVVLVADDNTGSYTSSPHMSCRVFDAPGQALRIYSDGTNYDPFAPTNYSGTEMDVKNQIQFTKEGMSDCMRPGYLTATEVGPDFVRLSWTEHGTSEQWYVNYGGDDIIANTNEDFLLEGLVPSSQYTIMVRPACDENLFSAPIYITTLEACPIPQEVEAANITGNAATVTWVGYSDSYLVQLGQTNYMFSENFDNGIPAEWDNSSTYPWTIVDGHIQSGNAGVASSTSSISVTVTFAEDGIIKFDAECLGEGTSTYWDHCDFYIDETRELYIGAGVSGWNQYSFNVTAGEHTFTWSYTKDGSVNPTGDHFAIDNIFMGSDEITWNDPVSVGDTEYTFRGLTSVTTYCVKVQGVCDGTATEWSETILFTTAEALVQMATLSAGTNWLSFNVEITLEELKAALIEALPGTSITIKSRTQNIAYNPNTHRWMGTLNSLDLTQTYMVSVSTDCEIMLTGSPINFTEYSITISNGANWIAFPFTESMSVSEAFAGFAINGDVIKSRSTNSSYINGQWRGGLNNLEPGQGYIYKSNATEDRIFTFPVSAK